MDRPGLLKTAGATRLLPVFLMLLAALPVALQAQFHYTANDDGITITGYTGTSGVVTIPDAIDGLPVTSIGDSAFEDCWNLTSVAIPSSVTSIGDNVFYAHYRLVAITVDAHNSVFRSVAGVLFDKRQTTLIQCPEGKTGTYAIPGPVTSIGNRAFSYCRNVEDVTIPGTVTNIGIGAFYGCSGLTNATIQNGVISIGDSAFTFCTGLTGVIIPASVTEIGTQAFVNCVSLEAIAVDEHNSVFGGIAGVLFDKSQTTLIQYPGGKAGTYAIPDGVTNIGDSAFIYCAGLTRVTIPDSLTRIGTWAFYGCSALTNVTMGKGLVSIGTGAYSGCRGLTRIAIPNRVTDIGDRVFYDCTSLTNVIFQGSAPRLGEYVFHGVNSATVYYLAGTQGWALTWGGLPALEWNPQPLTTDAGFGVRTNQFGFTITGASGIAVVVEACANLANPIWSPLQTNTLSDGAFYFSDTYWANHPGRFYRLRMP